MSNAKDDMIRAYVESQRLYSTVRTVQGPPLTEGVPPALNTSTLASNDDLNTSDGLHALTIPFCARQPASPMLVSRTSNPIVASAQKRARPPNRTCHSSPLALNPGPSPSYMPEEPTKPTRKANCMEEDNSDYIARLKLRRERKRARREITRPKPPKDDWNVENQSDDDNERRPAKKVKKKKINPAMALMHGFAADNVKGGRLTLRTSGQIGVFGKGKASSTAISTKPRSTKPTAGALFDELKFLTKSTKVPQRPMDEHPSEIPSECSPAPSSPPKGKSLKISNKMQRTKLTRPSPPVVSENGRVSPVNDIPVRRAGSTSGHESITWDIEKGMSLPDGSETASAVMNPGGPSTVMLDTKLAPWFEETSESHRSKLSSSRPTSTSEQQVPHDDRGNDNRVCSSPSAGSAIGINPSTLAPWHSASQCGRPPIQHPSHTWQYQKTIRAASLSDGRMLPPAIPTTPSGSPPDVATHTRPQPDEAYYTNYAIRHERGDPPQADDVPLPAHSRRITTPPLPTRPVDTLWAALQQYEADDLSMLHYTPETTVANHEAWRLQPGCDQLSVMSGFNSPVLRHWPAPESEVGDDRDCCFPHDTRSAIFSTTATELLRAMDMEDPSLLPSLQAYESPANSVSQPTATPASYENNADWGTNAYLFDFPVDDFEATEETRATYLDSPVRSPTGTDNPGYHASDCYDQFDYGSAAVIAEESSYESDEQDDLVYSSLAMFSSENVPYDVAESQLLSSSYDMPSEDAEEEENITHVHSESSMPKNAMEDEEDVVEHSPLVFSQGRRLLDSHAHVHRPPMFAVRAELDVIARLQHHWMPMKP